MSEKFAKWRKTSNYTKAGLATTIIGMVAIGIFAYAIIEPIMLHNVIPSLYIGLYLQASLTVAALGICFWVYGTWIDGRKELDIKDKEERSKDPAG